MCNWIECHTHAPTTPYSEISKIQVEKKHVRGMELQGGIPNFLGQPVEGIESCKKVSIRNGKARLSIAKSMASEIFVIDTE